MKQPENPRTHLCRSDLHTIEIRGKDLCRDLIGHMTFTEMILFHLLKTPPTEQQVRIVDAVLVTIMEHGLTPSAIAARQTLFGAPESLQGAVAAGILGVGDRFAGTSGTCAELLQEIVSAPKDERVGVAVAIVERFRASRRPIPGYGHPIHKEGDPRVTRLVEVATEVKVDGDYIAAMNLLGDAIETVIGKRLVVNATAGMAAVLSEAGVPPAIMRGLVLVSRAAGLVGHLQEEMEEPISNFVWDLVENEVPYAD